ncbi:MAG: MBL fold metallo-hydrolase [Candidatus Bathyarchaeota archaeon]|nr:MBL fold metallo-hydrolase [Candidatus Bathyarchaeota archaeon]
MTHTIKAITFGGVNCYLIKNNEDFVLIDTGFSKRRSDIEQQLETAGCTPGKLQLIVLTHGDFDHSGNAAYFREKYQTKIAMHRNDIGMVEKGDLFYNRDISALMRFFGKILVVFLRTRLNKPDRFTPDLCFEDNYNISNFGLNAQILHLPGHSKGSIGILTPQGDLFCGDLIENKSQPEKNTIMDDDQAFEQSIEKLKQLKVNTVYPGHGEPFQIQEFLKNHKTTI